MKFDFYEIFDEEFRSLIDPIVHTDKFRELKKYCAHGKYSVYDHCLRVALLSYFLAKGKKGVDSRSLVRAALLHDYYLYDWHHSHEGHRLHGFRHGLTAAKNARRDFDISDKEAKLIRGHMFPLTFWTLPLSKESRILVRADKIAAISETLSIREYEKSRKTAKA